MFGSRWRGVMAAHCSVTNVSMFYLCSDLGLDVGDEMTIDVLRCEMFLWMQMMISVADPDSVQRLRPEYE